MSNNLNLDFEHILRLIIRDIYHSNLEDSAKHKCRFVEFVIVYKELI